MPSNHFCTCVRARQNILHPIIINKPYNNKGYLRIYRLKR